VVVVLLGGLGASLARGERTQRGNLIASLEGGLSPLQLPREHPAPVAVRLEGGLQTADGSLLPRVTRVELGLASKDGPSTRGLPVCPQRRLRNTKSAEALAACGSALVGRGSLEADVQVSNQAPFAVHSRLLAFNGRIGGRRAVIMHAFGTDPPTAAVLPFFIRHRPGRFGTALVADLPSALGPWPHLAHFELTLFRRYAYRGQRRSYLSSTCPIPRNFPSGFFTFAEVGFSLAGGGHLSTAITRSCRAR
jgi:hypothetical protein